MEYTPTMPVWAELAWQTDVMKVHGGWIVRSHRGALVMVPDDGHRWQAARIAVEKREELVLHNMKRRPGEE